MRKIAECINHDVLFVQLVLSGFPQIRLPSGGMVVHKGGGGSLQGLGYVRLATRNPSPSSTIPCSLMPR